MPTLRADTPIYAALSTMRDSRNDLALVTTTSADVDVELVGLVTLHDLLDQLLPMEHTRALEGLEHESFAFRALADSGAAICPSGTTHGGRRLLGTEEVVGASPGRDDRDRATPRRPGESDDRG